MADAQPKHAAMPAPVRSRDVFEWPEFKALASRLGLDLGKPITKLSLFLDILDYSHIEVSYLGVDVQDRQSDKQSLEDKLKRCSP